jgi:filamentous hemagglutinin family protein
LAHAQSSIPADTTPQNGIIALGSATITQAPNLTTINQSSQNTAIAWQTFNVGSAATVQFNQPSSTATALNYVITPSPSIIAGKINANGQLILINQSGIVFTKGSEVNNQSLVAATSVPSNLIPSWVPANLAALGASRPGASIINDGNITVKATGLVGLIAPQVINNGTITAQLGQVMLAGASAFTLDLYGDGLISLDVTKAVQAVDVGGKTLPALVTNTGTIIADGGSVRLTAQDADALVTQLVNAGGTIRANTMGSNTGSIAITGVGGNISIAGNLLAQGDASGAKGGTIEALTDGTVAVTPTAVVSTSGDAGGGVIALGTNIARAQQGSADIAAPKADAVAVAPGASITADATGKGNGGIVTLLSAQNTPFQGGISVLGGPGGGNGGLAEIASEGVISFSGTVYDTALEGQSGEIVLEAPSLVVGGPNNAGLSDSATASYVSPSSLDGLSGTIFLDASSAIDVIGAVSMNSPDPALSLVSGGDVTIGNSIYVNGSLEVDASNSLVVGGGIAAENILLNGGSAGIDIDAPVDALGLLALSSPGTIFEGGGGGITAGILAGNGAADGDVLLAQSENTIATLGSFAASELVLDDTGRLTITGPVAASSASLSAADLLDSGNISTTNGLILRGGSLLALDGFIDAGTLLELESPGSITETGTVIAADVSSGGVSDGTVLLTDGNNSIGGIGTLAGDGGLAADRLNLLDLSHLNVGSLTANEITLTAPDIGFTGNVTATNLLALYSPGQITQSSGAITAGMLTSAGVTDGDIILDGSSNNIASLGNLQAASIDLADAGPLNVIGPVFASANASLDAVGIDIAGNLTAPELFLGSVGNVNERTGVISTGSLSGSASGNFVLDSNGNSIATLGNFNTGGNFSLDTINPLSITGSVSAQNATFSTPGLAINGVIQTGNLQLSSTAPITESGEIIVSTLTTGSGTISGSVDLSGDNSISNLGNFAGSGNLTIHDNRSLDISGIVNVDDALTLVASSNIQQTGGMISAATLTSNGSIIGGNVSLDEAGNRIPVLGNFAANGNITLNDADALTLQGDISNPTGALSLFSSGGITQASGSIATAMLNAIASDITLDDHGNSITTLGSVTATGNLSIGSVSGISGLLKAQNASLTANGDFLLDGITSIANQLILTADGNITQPGGTLFAQSATISTLPVGAEINLAGYDSVGGDLNFSNDGKIFHASGVLDAGTLTGTAGSLASFTGRTDFGTIGSFLMMDSLFSLDNTGTLTLIGPLVANVVSISATGELILDGSEDGGLFISSNEAAPNSTGPRNGVDSVLSVSQPMSGDGILQNGVFYVNDGQASSLYNNDAYLGTTNRAATLFILTASNSAPDGGNIQFAAGPDGLVAPSVDVVLGSGLNGIATGNMNVFHLEILNGKATDLTGIIDGVMGPSAAARGSALPYPESQYQFNGCSIGAIDCIVIPTEALPVENPLSNFDITERKRRHLDKNVQLPGVATRDF